MADQKETPKSNIIRKNTLIPEEKQEDFKKFVAERWEKKDSGKFSPETEAILKDIRLTSVSSMVAMEKAWLAREGDKSDRSVKLPVVEVGKYSEEALKQMGIIKPKTVEEGVDKNKTKDTDFLTKLFVAAIPLLAVGGALIGSIKGMMQGGPLQGVMNIISKVFVAIGDNIIKKLPGMGLISKFFMGKSGFIKTVFKNLFGKAGIVRKVFGKTGAKLGAGAFRVINKAFLKRLPIIGSLISLGSAIKRFKDGDTLGGLIDIGAAVAYMIPGVGTVLGLAFDLLNASSDIYGAKNNMGKSEAIGSMIVDAGKWIYEKVSSLIDSMLKYVADTLYNSPIPETFVDMGMDALGLQRYKRGATQKIELQMAEKRSKLNSVSDIKTKNKIRQELEELENELSTAYDNDLKSGKITRDELLQKRVGEMISVDDSQTSRIIRSDLTQRGYSPEEITKAFQELKKSMDEQTNVIKEAQQAQQSVVTSQVNNSSQTNVFTHKDSAITNQRSKRGRRGYTPTYMPA